ncbi:Eco57I restriction-modification methylase domain-containing protein [Pseudoroseomonas cervicalis]
MNFLDDYVPRRVTLALPEGLTLRGLHLGQGNLGLEVLVLDAATEPKVTALRQVWKDRLGGRAAPLLAIALRGDTAVICGPAGDDPPIRRIEAKQAERLCIRALGEPDRNAALRFLHDALPSLETELPGIRNEGLLADHILRHPDRDPRLNLTGAQAKAAPVLGAAGMDLLRRLGFGIEKADGVTSLLRTGSRDRAVAVLLDAGETPEGAAPRFQNLSPVSWALAMADQRNLPWVVVVQGDRVRLYPVELGVGVGRRGRTETWIELRTGLMRQDQAALLWLIFSVDALKPNGTLEELLDSSKRFASDLAVRLRERIYDRVIPGLATGIAKARGLKSFTADELRLTYAMALTVLFRLLFIAYAEDRDLLPFTTNEAYRHRALKTKALELAAKTAAPGPGTHLWQEVTRLFDAVREGDAALGVPAYGGGLFETDAAISKAGAALARITLPDTVFEPVLRGLLLDEGRDLGSPGAGPVDFRSLRVREFGTIYEGLLESELAVADTDLALKKQGKDFVYVPAKARDTVEVAKGAIYLHNRSGARKSSGSYFTPNFAVDHLLDTALERALEAHTKRLATLDDTEAAEAFFDIRVADIAMGSGHFLVAAVDRVERALSAILADHKRKLPGVMAELATLRAAAETELKKLGLEGVHQIEDGQLLRRLIARRCIYGVDLNPLAVELARLSIWIHTFVPGLPLSLLDHRLVTGNALVGMATLRDAKAGLTALAGVGLAVEPADMLKAAAPHLVRLARISDATPQDISEARRAYVAARDAVAAAVSLFDAATAVSAGHSQFRLAANEEIAKCAKAGRPPDLRGTRVYAQICEAVAAVKPLHLPAAFPEVFLRPQAGFDVIIGNPPWEKLRVEKHEFWARHFPGLRGIKDTDERDAFIRKMEKARPDLVAIEEEERAESEALRDAVRALPGMNTGHPDLFRAFMARFAQVLAPEGGRYGVVLPGDAFKIKGNRPVREDLDQRARHVDVQMLTNRGEWVFKDVHPQKPIALVAVSLGKQAEGGCRYTLRPEHHREAQFKARRLGDMAERTSKWLKSYSEGLVQPTLPTADAAKSVAVIETMLKAPAISEHPRLKVRRVYADVETTRDKGIYGASPTVRDAWPVYGGAGFDIWTPDTGSYYAWTTRKQALDVAQRKRANSPRTSPYGAMPRAWRDDAKTHPCLQPRVAFRNITNRTNLRTLVVSLIPGQALTVETAPWLLWLDVAHPKSHEAFALGVMSSISADWWMRRFVEGHVDEEAFESLRVPDADPSKGLGARVVALAGRLACPDDRFADWAKAVGVKHGPLKPDEKQAMIEELDAVVARLYGLSTDQLTHIFDTFHEWTTDAEWAAWNARRDRTVAILRGLA